MKSVITYTLNRCVRCLSCLRVCPTAAITKQANRVEIDHRNCINCGKCINVCETKGLQAKGSTLVDLGNYEYKIVLVPSNIYAMCKDMDDVALLYGGLEKIGFDEIIDISDIEGALLKRAISKSKNSDEYLILGSCPAVRKWIELEYPILLDKIFNQQSASEIAAKRLRKKYQNTKLGIFTLCSCPANLKMAKYPYGAKSEIDHALSVVDLFPKINALKFKSNKIISLCKEGLYSSSTYLLKAYLGQENLVIDGSDKLKESLELAEFNQLPKIKLFVPKFCNNGCIGGSLMWGNPYIAENNIRNLAKIADKACADISDEECDIEYPSLEKTNLSIQERIQRYEKLNAIIEQLPNFNCGACGYASCRKMAEEILAGRRHLSDCKILNYQKERYED